MEAGGQECEEAGGEEVVTEETLHKHLPINLPAQVSCATPHPPFLVGACHYCHMSGGVAGRTVPMQRQVLKVWQGQHPSLVCACDMHVTCM